MSGGVLIRSSVFVVDANPSLCVAVVNPSHYCLLQMLINPLMYVANTNHSFLVCCTHYPLVLKRKHYAAELAPFNRILKRDQALAISSMKVKTIEIAWHRRPEANHNDPVLSVDF